MTDCILTLIGLIAMLGLLVSKNPGGRRNPPPPSGYVRPPFSPSPPPKGGYQAKKQISEVQDPPKKP